MRIHLAPFNIIIALKNDPGVFSDAGGDESASRSFEEKEVLQLNLLYHIL